jgi:hypothetical protein
MKGLKQLRSEKGPVDPNQYWQRSARKRCPKCGRRVRGPNHDAGH